MFGEKDKIDLKSNFTELRSLLGETTKIEKATIEFTPQIQKLEVIREKTKTPTNKQILPIRTTRRLHPAPTTQPNQSQQIQQRDPRIKQE